MKNIEELIPDYLKDIQTIDEEIILDATSVAQAVDELRTALEKIDEHLDNRKFEEASQAGYGEVSSNFIFLQRVLGALQTSCDKRDSLISDISAEAKLPFEETWEVVRKRMNSTKPKNPRSS